MNKYIFYRQAAKTAKKVFMFLDLLGEFGGLFIFQNVTKWMILDNFRNLLFFFAPFRGQISDSV